jgi:hypothetical protein
MGKTWLLKSAFDEKVYSKVVSAYQMHTKNVKIVSDIIVWEPLGHALWSQICSGIAIKIKDRLDVYNV